MDVAVLTKKMLFYFLIVIGLNNVFAQQSTGDLHTGDGSDMVTVKWDSCKLKVSDFPHLGPGAKGEPGFPGEPGPVGPPGLDGLPGSCQCKITPKDGNTGVCFAEDTCELNSEPEHQEERGETRAAPHVPVTAAAAATEGYDLEGIVEFKSLDNDKICKYAPDDLESGNYTTSIGSGIFDIYCNMTTKETCIRRNSKTRPYEYNAENGTFWLSRVGINLRDIYNLTYQQISFLQYMSSSVRQTIKYHCFDSVPYPKLNTASAVKLLTWNDVILEPYPTSESPFFYSVPPETDGCVEGGSAWNSTIIEIRSKNANRLPITDIWIGDVRGQNQKIFIESVEICFG